MRRNRVGGLAEIWYKVKFPWYPHRLMHRKRVTCELHDRYFHLMTSKHAIPKIEWAIELLYNSVRTRSQWVREQRSWRKDVVEKTTTRQKALLVPPIEFGDQLVRRCRNENMSQRGWAIQENENDIRRCPEVLGRSICCSLCSGSNSLSQ